TLQRVGAGCQLACALGRLLLVGPRGLELGAHRREQLLRARRGGRCREFRGQPLDLTPQLALALCAGALERVRACRGLLLGVLCGRQLAAQRRQQLLSVRRGGRSGQLGAQPLDLSRELALTLALGGLERIDARRQLARALRGLIARILGGRQRLAQRRELLLGVGGSAGCGELGSEPVDLLPELALTQVGELAVDDVLEPRAQLEQLDLVDRDLALELGELRWIDAGAVGLGRAGLARRRSGVAAGGDLLHFALTVGERR